MSKTKVTLASTMQAALLRQLGLLSAAISTQYMLHFEPRAYTGPSGFSTTPLWGNSLGARIGESTHIRGTEQTQTQPSGLLPQQFGI